MHVPVLLQEVLEMLDPRPGDFMIDGTVDGGGHAAAILEAIGPSGRFLGLDLDQTMLADCKTRIVPGKGVTASRRKLCRSAGDPRKGKTWQGERILLDLGFSSEQIERSGRGFSFSDASRDEPLLMTYDDSRPPAREILIGHFRKRIGRCALQSRRGTLFASVSRKRSLSGGGSGLGS